MQLSTLKKKEVCRIIRMPEDTVIRNFLLVNGFFVGAELKVNANDSLRGLMHLSVGGRFVAIRRTDAVNIEVIKF